MQPSSIRYCPCCAEKLDRIKIIDIHADGFRCVNCHFLHLLRESVLTWQHMGTYLDLKSGKEAPEEILEEWLSNPSLRDHLNDNLAGVIRCILDKKNGKQPSKEYNSYDFCPTCGEKLHDEPTDDYYVSTLKCENDHSFYSRGGIWSSGSRSVILCFDYDENYFEMSLKFWMEGKGDTKNFFPHELKEAVKKAIKGMTK